MNHIRRFLKSINTKIALTMILLLLATIEIIGAYFTRQLEQSSINSFQTSIQIPALVNNQIARQLSSNRRNADRQLNQIVNDYSNSNISDIEVVDNKDTIRAVSNLNDQNNIGRRSTNADVKKVTSSGRQLSRIVNDHGATFMVQITPVMANNGTGAVVGAIIVRASMQNVFDNIRNVSVMFLSAALASAVLSAILSLLISRAITHPIEEMRQQAVKISNGDYSGRVHVYSNDELGQLATAFNNLSVKVEQTQETTESERRRLDSILTHMTDGVIATDRHGNVTIINQTALDFLNKTEKEAIGKPITKLLKLKDISLQDLMSQQQETILTVNEGSDDELILHATFSLIQSVTGFVSGAICVLHDVTEQQKNENEQKQFVSNVSHELRTPLTSLRAYIEALNEGAWKDPKIAPQFLDVTQKETERMIRMINDLLSLSRMDRGTAKMELEWINFNDFFNHILNRFDMMIKANKDKQTKKYTIKREFTSQDLWAEVDPDKMMQVIDNIMNNAIKYSPDGGVITARLWQANNKMIISISDQGLGIPRQDLTKIFDRFYRVDKARSRAQGGTGLGLAISKEIVEAHHGRIWADSAEGKGSTFYISLPYEPMVEDGDEWDEV